MKNILWVEDENDYYNTFSAALLDFFIIEKVRNYTEAITSITKNSYDILIVDIIIPSGYTNISLGELLAIKEKYFGIEFIKYVRHENINTPIIVLSVVQDKETIESIKKLDRSIELLLKYDSSSESLLQIATNVITKRCIYKTKIGG